MSDFTEITHASPDADNGHTSSLSSIRAACPALLLEYYWG